MNETAPFTLTKQFKPLSPNAEPTANSLPEDQPGRWFIFCDEKLLVDIDLDKTVTIPENPPESLNIPVNYFRCFGYYSGKPCFVGEATHRQVTKKNYKYFGLRRLFGILDNDSFNLAGRAFQALHHHREHKFCSKCGTVMEERDNELAKFCPSCGYVSFPRVSPAVIMAVTKQDKILLGRAPHFPSGMYSTLAGFVELGETLEEAVVREVSEETSIVAGNVRYMASQPWPFPHSIMLGFTASYVSGEISIDTNELEDARWFARDSLPKLPSKITIARMLIDDFVNKNQ